MVGCGRPSKLPGLRRAGDHQRVDAGGLRRHHVHHHARRVDGVAAGHVEPDPLDRNPPLGDGGAGRQRRRDVGATLVGVHGAGAFDRHLAARPATSASRLGQRGVQRGIGHPDGRRPHPVERFAVLQGGFRAALGDRVDDRPHLRQHRFHVDAAAGQRRPQTGRRTASAPRRSMRAIGDSRAVLTCPLSQSESTNRICDRRTVQRHVQKGSSQQRAGRPDGLSGLV